jgi:hypothetical protein
LPTRIVGMAPSSGGRGYWLAARDGSVYTYGAAPHAAALPNLILRLPVTGIAASASGRGYLLMSKFGDVAPYGDASECISSFHVRDRESGSFQDENVGIAIPFAASAVAGNYGGSCGSQSKQFLPRAPFRIDVTTAPGFAWFGRSAACVVMLYADVPQMVPNRKLQLQQAAWAVTPGRMEVRSTQMHGGVAFAVETTPNCLAVARPGAGGTQRLPFTTKTGGDTLPFTSASPITIDSKSKKVSAQYVVCNLKVYRNSDGRIVYAHQGTESHVVLPAGNYFLRSDVRGCPVSVK